MPAIVSNAPNMLIDSDYPLDKIIYMTSGSFVLPGYSGLGTITQVPHFLPFRPLVIGTWSTDANFTTSKECFAPIFTDVDGTYVEASADDTYVTLNGINYVVGAADKTIYFRVYGFMPSDVNLNAPFTASAADKFALSTDYNYTKLYYNDIIPATASTAITHNFGYRPQVIAWVKNYNIYGTQMVNRSGVVKVDTTSVVVTSATKDVHLRIYLDKQL